MRGKKRLAVWYLRMAVYYQARSSEEINRHHLESKCPNIMKGRRTKTQWNMWHFMILKKHVFQPSQSIYLFCCYLVAFPSLFTTMAFLCACNSLSSCAFFEFSLSPENMQYYLCFLKSFPCFILAGGKIGVLPESSLIWACVTTSQRST